MSHFIPKHHASIAVATFFAFAASSTVQAQVNGEINRSVWKQKFGVLDAQMNEQAPYADWWSMDTDGDGTRNDQELIAGTNPFPKSPTDVHFRTPSVTADSSALSLTFPTVPGKVYGVQRSMTLVDTWLSGGLPSVIGDGTTKTLVVPESAGKFFRVTVTDQASQGDQVSDWAKHMLGFSLNSPIQSQTGYDPTTLASSLAAENVVSISPMDTYASQPPDASSAGSDVGSVKVTRTGGILLGSLTVPLIKSGTATEGLDYTSLPSSLTFPAGVSSIEVNVVPLFNAARKSGATVFLAAGSPEAASADGNYTLGSPSAAGITIYPASNPTGSGLTANYFAGASSTYSSPLNFGGKTANYSYTKSSTTLGSVTVTYSGIPTASFAVGANVTLRFTSGNLNVSAYNSAQTYTITATNGTTNFSVAISGTSVPNNGSGNCEIGNFSSPFTRIDPVIDLVWGSGTPDASTPVDNFSARWTGQILPQYSQKYYFIVNADDGVRLWINNQLIIDRWSTSGSGSDTVGSIDLQGGVYYDIKMEYFEASGSAQSRLWWYSDDQPKMIIPTNRLFPKITGTEFAAAPSIISPPEAVAILGAESPFSMNVASSNGGVITATGLPSWLSLVNGILSGTPTIAGVYQFTLTTTNSSGTSSSVMTIEVLATPGQLTRETWTSGVGGKSLASVPWTSSPSTSSTVPSAESSSSGDGSNMGERLRGYFIAPSTGNYYFWIAASNVAELWVSNDSEPVNKVLRASVVSTSTVPPKTWNVQAGQKSAWLSLTAGHKYYIEALHNTGATGVGNHLSIAWFIDPTGRTTNPINNGGLTAAASTGGVIPGYVLSPWNNPPTTTIPGNLYVTNLQGANGLSGITGTGGAFLRVNGNSAILQLNYSGLTSGATARTIQHTNGTVLFDLNAQEKNYPNLKSTDGGYTWNLSGSDLSALQSGNVRINISTVNNPSGELTGTFGLTAGSQTAPPVPAYPSWTSLHASSDAANSRFLTQATFGPGPSDMAYVKANGYRAWIDNQFTLATTKNVPYILANLSNDPQNAYGSSLMFNSWWKNSITAQDQLRQRAAFALSQILVVSDVGPLNNNGRVLADYYDSLLDTCFGNFRDILKQVTLSPAMGVYLDMRANAKGNISTGLHPNENYAREILQLFSAGLYRLWPDGSLVLNSAGQAVPTYDQSVITGYARVFTGWNWGQALLGTGRLPTAFGPSANYLDPMVLVPSQHELGTKILLDNVVLPAAAVTSQSDSSTDPSSTYSIQSPDPVLGAGNLVTTLVTNNYDLNGIKDLEAALDKIMENSAVGPYICRQLIQRLVTSDPKPEYLHRVVRAYNGERNVDEVATGVRGDMKEVFRAILLDYEARDPAAAADPKYGKQREPLLRVTGPVRTFPAADITNCSYRQIGLREILVTTPIPHRLAGETVRLSNFVDAGGSQSAFKVPTTQSYGTANSTPSYSLVGATGIVTVNSPGYQIGDSVQIQFTSGTLNISPYNTIRPYTVVSASPTNFTINIGTTAIASTTGNSNNALLPYNFTITNNATLAPSYKNVGNIVTLTHAQSSSGIFAGTQLFIRFATGGLSGEGFDGVYTVTSASATEFTISLASSPPNSPDPPLTPQTALIPMVSGGYNVTTSGSVSTILIQHTGNHNLEAGDSVWVQFLLNNSGIPAPSGVYTVASINGPNSFRITTTPAVSNGSQGSGGAVAYPLKLNASQWTRSGTVNLELSTWGFGKTDNTLNQTPLNSTTVFNFFYPDYRFPGEIALAGMTTPEFQLTNDSNNMVLTNTITQTTLSNNSGNNNGYVSFSGNSATLDLAPYLTAAQTTNAAIPALVDSLNALLTSGNLTNVTKTHIVNYITGVTGAANTPNYPLSSPPTAVQIRNRVRAIVHLIVISAEYAIQR